MVCIEALELVPSNLKASPAANIFFFFLTPQAHQDFCGWKPSQVKLMRRDHLLLLSEGTRLTRQSEPILKTDQKSNSKERLKSTTREAQQDYNGLYTTAANPRKQRNISFTMIFFIDRSPCTLLFRLWFLRTSCLSLAISVSIAIPTELSAVTPSTWHPIELLLFQSNNRQHEPSAESRNSTRLLLKKARNTHWGTNSAHQSNLLHLGSP